MSDPTASMPTAEIWFGEAFDRLHPQLRALHRDGGALTGPVAFDIPSGPRGIPARFALRRLGIDPALAAHTLSVDIRNLDGALHWARRFDGGREAVSMFEPRGHWPDGHWCERVGPFELILGVDIDAQGGWRWRQRGCKLFGVRFPLWAMPQVAAGKSFSGEHYRFDVALALPLFGRLLAWKGALRMAS